MIVLAPLLDLHDMPGHPVRLAQQRHTRLWSAEFCGDLTGPQYAVVSTVGCSSGEVRRTVGELASLDSPAPPTSSPG